MTRVYEAGGAGATGLRVLLVGAGHYPKAKGQGGQSPAVEDLGSVAPSILALASKVLGTWRDDFTAPLLSLDVLLSDPDHPAGSAWPGFGVAGEVAPGTPVDPATLDKIAEAIDAVAVAADRDDTLFILFCGHGVSKGKRYFLASDFGARLQAPWEKVVDLTELELGLRQTPARTQWLFWDCCADVPSDILDVLGSIGNGIITPLASELAKANSYKDLSRFGIASSPLTGEAFGVPGEPSRFIEMLIEAVDGAGASGKRHQGRYCVDEDGIIAALRSFSKRKFNLDNPGFYAFITPYASEAPERMVLRRTAEAPTSLLIARAQPRPRALKESRVVITPCGGGPAAFDKKPPQAQAVLYVSLPALQEFDVVAIPGDGEIGDPHAVTRVSFSWAPLAEEVEFELA